ncbi:gp58-like family protein [Latilactobacillus sakei]
MEGNTVTLSCYTRFSKNGGQLRVYFKVTDSNGNDTYYGINDIHDLSTGWKRYSTTAKLPSDIKAVNLTFQWLKISPDVSCYVTGAMLTMGDQLLPYQDSNLDVVNQINVSSEGILIDGKKVHITGQTSIDNAVIKDAMIANVTADKITGGTLNAANVNVINLNANNITTGTIKGANLSMNLNTGEVVFQKGAIRSTNGNLNIDISKGTMAVINQYKSGFYFEDGKLVLNDGQVGRYFEPA